MQGSPRNVLVLENSSSEVITGQLFDVQIFHLCQRLLQSYCSGTGALVPPEAAP